MKSILFTKTLFPSNRFFQDVKVFNSLTEANFTQLSRRVVDVDFGSESNLFEIEKILEISNDVHLNPEMIRDILSLSVFLVIQIDENNDTYADVIDDLVELKSINENISLSLNDFFRVIDTKKAEIIRFSDVQSFYPRFDGLTYFVNNRLVMCQTEDSFSSKYIPKIMRSYALASLSFRVEEDEDFKTIKFGVTLKQLEKIISELQKAKVDLEFIDSKNLLK